MRIDILTLFPAIFASPLQESILKRAQLNGFIQVHLHDIRQWTGDKHHTADDRPFGGGPGMVLKPEPIFAAIESLALEPGTPVLLTCPRGRPFDQALANELSRQARLVIICGRYEGIDERVRQHLVTEAVSIGDYVLTGGELPALVIIDAVTRLIPGVVGKSESIEQDSFMEPLLDCPHYTRPASFRGWDVPEVLLSGDHQAIARWRRQQQLQQTRHYRPELLARLLLSPEDCRLLDDEKGDKYGKSWD